MKNNSKVEAVSWLLLGVLVFPLVTYLIGHQIGSRNSDVLNMWYFVGGGIWAIYIHYLTRTIGKSIDEERKNAQEKPVFVVNLKQNEDIKILALYELGEMDNEAHHRALVERQDGSICQLLIRPTERDGSIRPNWMFRAINGKLISIRNL